MPAQTYPLTPDLDPRPARRVQRLLWDVLEAVRELEAAHGAACCCYACEDCRGLYYVATVVESGLYCHLPPGEHEEEGGADGDGGDPPQADEPTLITGGR
jgi:hypothetical protein